MKTIDTQENLITRMIMNLPPTKEYLKSMPDLQNGDTIKGSKVGLKG